MFQFPPSGLDAGNSFFAQEAKDKDGRRYVGILVAGTSSDDTSAIRLFAALLYGAKAMAVDKEEKRDPYWTNNKGKMESRDNCQTNASWSNCICPT